MPVDAFAGRRCLVTGGLGFIGSNLALALAARRRRRHGPRRARRAPRREPAEPRARRRRRARPAHRGGRRRPRRRADRADVRDAARRRRRRVQPRRAGEPRRLDGRPAVRPRVEHHEPVRVPRAAPAREPDGDASCTRRPARSSASRATCRSTRTTRSRRSTSTASRSTRPSSCTSCTTRCTGCGASAVRLTNVFGPRQRLRDDFQGFLPIFVRRALADETITVFGDGAQERDCLYVDDVVECLLLAAAAPEAPGEIFNVGNDEHLVAAARSPTRSCAAAGSGRVEHVAVAPRPRRDRHRLLLRRLVEGEADARLGAAHVVRRRHRAHARVLPGTRARGTCDADASPSTRDPGRRPRPPGGARSSPSSPRRSTACRALGRVPPRPRARGVRARVRRVHRAAATRSASRRAPTRCASRCVALGVGPGDEVIVPAFTAVPDRRRGVRDRRGAGVRRRRPRHRRRSIPTPRPRRGHRPHARGDPGAPLRAAGGAARPRRARARGRRAGARRARPAGRLGRGAYSFYPTKNLGGIGDGGAVRHRRRRARGARSACCGPTALTDDYVHTRVVDQRPAVRGRGGRAAGRAPRGSTADNAAPARDRGALPRGRAATCAGRRRTSATCTTCAWRGSPTATRSARGCRSTPACTTRGRSPSSLRTGSSSRRRARKPKRGRPSACRCRASPR